MITIFRSLFQTDVPFHLSFDKSIQRIKEGKSKVLIEKIRNAKNKSDADKFKKQLPAILFSGKFSERSKKGLKAHSGYMVIDFDDFEDEVVYVNMFNELKSNKHIALLFRSPSGNGIKAVVRIPSCTAEEHERYFGLFNDEFKYNYFDKANCDVSRVCFESYDPYLYYNPDAEVFEPKLVDKGFSVSEKVVHTPLTDEDRIISRIMDWDWKYDFVEGERNNFAYVLSRSFCEYGVSEQSAKSFVVNHYSDKDFGEREIENTVKSAYRSTAFGVKKFIDYDKKKEFEKDIKHKPKKEVLEKYNINEDDYERQKKDITVDEFWYLELDKNGKEKIKVDPYKYKVFLEQNGFKKTYLNESQKPTFVKIMSNIVEETSVEKVKDFVLDYLLSRRHINIWSYFASYAALFSENYLLMLDSIELMMLDDKREKSFIAFKNGILEVTKKDTNMVDYIDVDGYIWRSHIVDRDFRKSPIENDYKKFIENISHSSPKPLESTIGYLVHTYKNKMNNKAIIFNDEAISDNPEGGTGKGLIIQGIRRIRRTSILDGKTFDDKKSFAYQTVSKDTQVLVFDDVKKNWDFESKFSIVTEGITLERKNKDAIKLPVEQSPKMVISTNYVIRGAGNSHDRRRHEIEIAQYYGENKTPYEDFGRQLFDDWNAEDYNRFDNYIVYCLQLYLNEGLISQEDAKNIEARKLIAETNKEFYEWAMDGNLPINVRIYRAEKYHHFIDQYPDYAHGRFKLSQKSFKIYIDNYAKYLGLEAVDDRDVSGRYSEIVDNNAPKDEIDLSNEVPF